MVPDDCELQDGQYSMTALASKGCGSLQACSLARVEFRKLGLEEPDFRVACRSDSHIVTSDVSDQFFCLFGRIFRLFQNMWLYQSQIRELVTSDIMLR